MERTLTGIFMVLTGFTAYLSVLGFREFIANENLFSALDFYPATIAALISLFFAFVAWRFNILRLRLECRDKPNKSANETRGHVFKGFITDFFCGLAVLIAPIVYIIFLVILVFCQKIKLTVIRLFRPSKYEEAKIRAQEAFRAVLIVDD